MSTGNPAQRESEFPEFSTFRSIVSSRQGAYSNVIKASALEVKGEELVGTGDGDSAPRVIVQKSAEGIESVEFQCPCGRKATLHFCKEGE